MRRILIEHARGRGRQKRGGGRRRLPLEAIELTNEEGAVDVLAVDEALRRLEKEDPEVADVVCLRFFAGLSVEQVASLVGKSSRTVAREWAYARAWLYRTLADKND